MISWICVFEDKKDLYDTTLTFSFRSVPKINCWLSDLHSQPYVSHQLDDYITTHYIFLSMLLDFKGWFQNLLYKLGINLLFVDKIIHYSSSQMCRCASWSDTFMITSSNGNIFWVTGLLCGEFTGPRWISHTKASDAGLWSFLWSVPEQTVEQTIETPAIWDAIGLIMTSLYCYVPRQWLWHPDLHLIVAPGSPSTQCGSCLGIYIEYF